METTSRNKRGARGQGSVFQDSGRWVAKFNYRDELNQAKTWKQRFSTQLEAEQALAEFKVRSESGQSVEDLTVGQWLDRCMAEIYAHKIRPNTLTLYRGFISFHLQPLALIPLRKLTTAQCELVLTNLKMVRRKWTMSDNGKQLVIDRSQPLGPQSANHVRRFLIGSLNHAVRLGHLDHNPAQRTLAKRVVQHRPRVLSKPEVSRLLGAFPDPFNRTLFMVQLLLGLRIAEVLGIKWTDIQGSLLTLERQVQRNRLTKQLGVGPLKTDRSHRTLVMPQILREQLAAMPLRGEYVFGTANGTLLDPRNAQRALYAAAKRAGLDDVSTHTLRRTFATLQLEAGTDVAVIRDQLGHTDLRTTTIYARTSLKALETASEKAAAFLQPDPTVKVQ